MPQQAMNGLAQQIFLIGMLFAIFYFIVFRPQKKQEQERQKMLNSLAKNDEIVTTGGVHGTVVNVKEKTVILRIDENVKIEVERNCVAFVKKSQGVTNQGK